jgi:drug/metabolite transporter (DMT)-like permease
LSSATATALILVSALLHASWNVFLRNQRDTTASACVVILGSALLAAAAALLGTRASPEALQASFAFGALAGVFEALYFLSLARALKRAPVGPVYAMSRGLPLLLVWPASHFFLKESVTFGGALAVFTLLGGLLLLLPRSDTKPSEGRGLAWAVATAACIAVGQIVYKLALSHGAEPAWLFATSMTVAFPMTMLALREPLPRLWTVVQETPLGMSLAALACAASFLLALLVLRGQGAAWVLTLRNSSIAFVQLLGWIALRERPSPRALAGVALVFGGALWLGLA